MQYNKWIPFVFSIFTFSPFPSNALFHLLFFPLISSKESHTARLSVHNNSINEPSLKSSNDRGLKVDPQWTPTFREKQSDYSPLTETTVLRPWYNNIPPFTMYFGTHFRLKAKWITSMVPDQKLFYNQKITFLFEFKFSSKSSQNKNSIDSPPPPPKSQPWPCRNW